MSVISSRFMFRVWQTVGFVYLYKKTLQGTPTQIILLRDRHKSIANIIRSLLNAFWIIDYFTLRRCTNQTNSQNNVSVSHLSKLKTRTAILHSKLKIQLTKPNFTKPHCSQIFRPIWFCLHGISGTEPVWIKQHLPRVVTSGYAH